MLDKDALEEFAEAEQTLNCYMLEDNRVITDEENQFAILNAWGKHIADVHRKGLTPLFVTGSGISISDSCNIMGIDDIIYDLKEKYEKAINNSDFHGEANDITHAFKQCRFKDSKTLINERDRSVYAKLFHAFQNRKALQEIWSKTNETLLGQILQAEPTDFHIKLRDLYKTHGAQCMTMNFDGLMVRALNGKRKNNKIEEKVRAFCLHTKKDCRKFFTRTNELSKGQYEFAEVQLRGDILFMRCNNNQFCTQSGKLIPFIHHVLDLSLGGSTQEMLGKLLKCSVCGESMMPYLSFPGSYEKEKEIKEMLAVVWRYLSYNVGCVTVAGLSGNWDPLIVGFLGDLLSERNIKLLVVEPYAEDGKSDIVKELVNSGNHKALTLQMDANSFANNLNPPITESNKYDDNRKDWEADEDYYWNNELNWTGGTANEFNQFELHLIRNPILRDLEKSSQLGLKSHWIRSRYPSKNTRSQNQEKHSYIEKHNRLNHSRGVTMVASYLYKELKGNGWEANNREWRFLRLAALLHDIGHLQFSHLIEEVYHDLNWVPADYNDHYSHTLQTESRIRQLYHNQDGCELKTYLKTLGYSLEDLIRLINGHFGIPYMDAIINSAVDADKMDYIFRDSFATSTNISLGKGNDFMNDIVQDVSITAEGLIAYSGQSAIALRELLKTRTNLYNKLYFTNPFRILDGITKTIISTYFVHNLKLTDENIWSEISQERKGFPDYGHYKIMYSIKMLENIKNSHLESSREEIDKYGLEFLVLRTMLRDLEKKGNLGIISNQFIANLQEGFNLIEKINKATKEPQERSILRKMEKRTIRKTYRNQDNLHKVKNAAKTCSLRMPGVLIIDILTPRPFLSASDERKAKLRNDDTNVPAECILVPKGKPEEWDTNSKAEIGISESQLAKAKKKGFQMLIFKMTEDEAEAELAINLLERLLDQETAPSPIE